MFLCVSMPVHKFVTSVVIRMQTCFITGIAFSTVPEEQKPNPMDYLYFLYFLVWVYNVTCSQTSLSGSHNPHAAAVKAANCFISFWTLLAGRLNAFVKCSCCLLIVLCSYEAEPDVAAQWQFLRNQMEQSQIDWMPMGRCLANEHAESKHDGEQTRWFAS